MEQGWCYGEGSAIRKDILDSAEQLFFELFLRSFSTDAFPGISGEVRVTGYGDDSDYFEFTFESSDDVTFLHELRGVEVEYREHLSLRSAIDEVVKARDKTIWKELCTISGLSTPNIGTGISKGFKVLHLTRQATAGYLYSKSFAPLKIAGVIAGTLKTITKTNPARLQSSGDLTPTYSHQ